MSQRRVVADSSSIILLHKVKLFETFTHLYYMVITGQVYGELLAGAKEGSTQLRSWLHERVEQCILNGSLAGMGRGESSVIALYLEGGGDFVLLDDKKGAMYCKKLGIPFINSLLVPRILYFAGVINEVTMQEATRLLIKEGYYSPQIIKKAENITVSDLHHFFPHA